MPLIEIILFGNPQIQHNGVPLEFARRKAIALVAYLAVTHKRHSRAALAEFLWPNNDALRSSASLRRVLSTIGQTPLVNWIEADRDTISLDWNGDIFVDVNHFNHLLIESALPESLVEGISLYRDNFMVGFTLRDSAAFDHWQSSQTQNLQQKLFATLKRLTDDYIQREQLDNAAAILRQWLNFDPLHEAAQHQLIEIYARTGQRAAALTQYDNYTAILENELGVAPQVETRQLYERIKNRQLLSPATLSRAVRGSLPPLPSLVVGREHVVTEVKQRLNIGVSWDDVVAQSHIVLHGWPGIGKTTLSSVLAHDSDVQNHYQDGILWASLGQHVNLMPILSSWGRALGFFELESAQTVDEASTRLTAFLKDRHILIILDDAWATEHVFPLRVGGPQSGLVITTRLNDVAHALSDRPETIYKIPILSIDESLTLLRTLAPEVITQYPHEARELASDLEGLPLALQVAGRLLHAEMEFGWGLDDLLSELRKGKRLLEAQAPADRTEPATETTPTIGALLQRSIERLSPDIQEQFALLGAFAPKPATFTLEAMQAVLRVRDAKPVARILIGRGLLEVVNAGRFQMHALLVMHAQSMFQEL